jgi:hypothetical protein
VTKDESKDKKPASAVQNATKNFAEKNVHICKTLFNVAHCLGSILDSKSWFIILQTMQEIEEQIKIFSSKIVAGATPSNSSNNEIKQGIDFIDLKRKVSENMTEYNIIEEARKKRKRPSKKFSSKGEIEGEGEDDDEEMIDCANVDGNDDAIRHKLPVASVLDQETASRSKHR